MVVKTERERRFTLF